MKPREMKYGAEIMICVMMGERASDDCYMIT